MERNVALKIAKAQQIAAKDSRYLALWEEYRVVDTELLSLMEKMPREDADIVEQYLSVTGEMYRLMLEFACK